LIASAEHEITGGVPYLIIGTNFSTNYQSDFKGSRRQEAIMSDDLSKKGYTERNQIKVYEEWDRTYWAKALGVTEDQLRQAVIKVGPQPQAVRTYLGRRQP
jgi:hypothetical protein